MARRVVNEIIDQFRQRFQRNLDAQVPLALRQDAPDVVFSALLEDDKPVNPEDSLLGAEGLSELPQPLPGGMDTGMTIDDLLGASGGPLGAPSPLAPPPLADPMLDAGMEGPELSPLPPEL